MTLHLGDVPASSTLYIPFHTFNAAGASITITGLAVTDIEIYKNGSVTQRSSDAGYTLLDTDGIDFDGLTGIHGFSIDLSDNTDAGFFAVGSFYWIVVSTITIDGNTVSFVAATFRIVAAEAVAGKPKVDVDAWLGTAAATPTTAGVPEVDVTFWLGTAAATPSVAGVPEVDVTHWIGTAAATPTVAGVPEVDVTHWIGTAAATPTTAGVPEVDVTFWRGEAVPATSQTGVPEVDLTHIAGVLVSTTTAQLGVNVVQISADSTAADNLESEYDGTGYGHILQRTTIATLASQTSFTLTAGSADNDAYNGCVIVIQDASTAAQKAVGVISDYVGATKTVTLLNDPAVFTMATTDIVTVIADRALKATVDNRTLDVSATGDADADVVKISTDATAADTLELFVEALDQTTGQIDSGSFAAGAIDAAAIAADAIGSSELAGSAADEIADAVVAALGVSGNAASAGVSLATEDVDIYNMALDLLHEAPITAFTDDTPEAEWGERNYVTSRNAELREHRWRFAIKRRTLYPSDFLLDSITATLTGAWAPFKLTEKWHGDLIKLRRSSDDTEDDFGVGTDDGDDRILLDTDAVTTFVGSGNSGYFSQIYDQSGNGNHLVQATTTKQPLYVGPNQSDAQVNGDNDRPVASFDGSNDVLSTSVAVSSLMSVSTGYMVIAGLIDALTLDSATKASNHLLMGDASSKLGAYVRKGGIAYGLNDDGSVDAGTDGVPMLVPFVVEVRHDGGSIYIRINGDREDSATSGDTSSLAGILNIGDLTAGSQALDFKMFAALTFSTIPSLAQRNRIASRLMRWAAVPGHKDYGWAYRYPIPNDCIRMLPVRQDGEFEGRLIKHEIEERYILTDTSTSLKVRYISEFSDASRFDPLFKEALAARMASKLAHWLTGKMGAVEIMGRAYNTAIEKARLADSLEGSDERPADDDVIDQRYDAEGVR